MLLFSFAQLKAVKPPAVGRIKAENSLAYYGKAWESKTHSICSFLFTRLKSTFWKTTMRGQLLYFVYVCAMTTKTQASDEDDVREVGVPFFYFSERTFSTSLQLWQQKWTLSSGNLAPFQMTWLLSSFTMRCCSCFCGEISHPSWLKIWQWNIVGWTRSKL